MLFSFDLVNAFFQNRATLRMLEFLCREPLNKQRTNSRSVNCRSVNCPSVKDVCQERFTGNHFPLLEKFSQRGDYRWCTVTSVVQCILNQLVEQNISSRLPMTTLGVVLSEVFDKVRSV